jgi:hypothetical protein
MTGTYFYETKKPILLYYSSIGFVFLKFDRVRGTH